MSNRLISHSALWFIIVLLCYPLNSIAQSFASTEFRVYCAWPQKNSLKDYLAASDPDPPVANTCLSRAKKRQIEVWASRLAKTLNAYRFGNKIVTGLPVFEDQHSKTKYHRLYVVKPGQMPPNEKITFARTDEEKNGLIQIFLNADFLMGKAGKVSKIQALHFVGIAHELFHIAVKNTVVQQSLARKFLSTGRGLDWLHEGMANAFAYTQLAKQLPSQSRKISRTVTELPYGERNYYDFSLLTSHDRGSKKGYATSHFWIHLAQRYQRDKLTYLSRFLKRKPDKHAKGTAQRNWHQWLSNNLASFKKRLSLPKAFAGFLTEYASWGHSRYRTQYEDRQKNMWLQVTLAKTLKGCEQITLSPTKRTSTVTFSQISLTGRCYKIIVSGHKTQPVTVSAEFTAKTSVQDIYLGMALSNATLHWNDRKLRGFNCYTVAERSKIQPACLLTPSYATRKQTRQVAGGEVVFWSLPEQTRKTGSNIETYVVASYIARSNDPGVHKKRLAGSLKFGLALTQLTLNAPGAHVKHARAGANLGASDNKPQRKQDKLDPLQWLKQSARVSGVLNQQDVASLGPVMGFEWLDKQPLAQGLAALRVRFDNNTDDVALDSASSPTQLMLMFDPPVAFGFSGTRLASLGGGTRLPTGGHYAYVSNPPDYPPVKVDFIAFDEDTLSVNIDGSFCAYKVAEETIQCQSGTLHGSVILPFAWTYDAAQTPAVSHNITAEEFAALQGERMLVPHNQNQARLPGQSGNTQDSDLILGDSVVGGALGASEQCDCSCEAYQQIKPQIQAKQPDVLGCTFTCANQYLLCEQ